MWGYLKRLVREEAEQEAKAKENKELTDIKDQLAKAEIEVMELKQQVESQDKTILKLQTVIYQHQNKLAKEVVQKFTKEDIENTLTRTNSNLVGLKSMREEYMLKADYRGRFSRRESPVALDALIQDTEDYIELLTREKYRKILQEEEN
jgi:uncharacterized NAD(P)/FAD-binding protein YdhS